MTQRLASVLAAGAMVLVMPACGDDEVATTPADTDGATVPATAETPVDVAVTLPDGSRATVRGFLHEADGTTRLCEAILESYPPQCGGATLAVQGLDWSTVTGVEEASGVRWKEGVELTGTVSGEVLTVQS